MMKVLFFDTNVLLHYRFPSSVDWCSLLKTDRVLVVVAAVVFEELDRHKNSSSPLLRKRAASAIRQLSRVCEPLQSGVAVSYDPPLAGLDEMRVRVHDRMDLTLDMVSPELKAEDQLSRDWNDDVLLGHALRAARRNPTADVEFVTADTALRFKALRFRVPTRQPPDTERLPDEPDPNEKSLAEVRQELAALKSAAPVLRLSFVNGDPPLRLTVRRYGPVSAAELETALNKVKSAFPLLETQADRERRRGPMRGLTVSLISDDQVLASNARRERYFAEVRRYIESLHEADPRARTVRIDLRLENVGTKPAEHVQLDLEVDARNVALASSPPKPPPWPEKPPKAYAFDVNLLLGSRDWASHIHDLRRAGPPDLSSIAVEGTRAFLQTTRLMHTRTERCAPLFVTFNHPTDVTSFGVRYSVVAANCPKPLEGQLNVVVTQTDGGSILNYVAETAAAKGADDTEGENDR
jgi:hypothetical protein